VEVYTGDGKGKTTAALGLALRALGAGLRVAVLQFLKGGVDTSELAMLPRLGPGIWLARFADEVTPFSLGQGEPTPQDREAVAKGWAVAREVLGSGEWDVVVLDEINNALAAGLLDVADVLEVLRRRPDHVEVVCTGRGAPEELVDAADLVTEMRSVRHPYDRELGARRGIED
jgi:cob(I)alamin adenosyltransferase